MAKDWQNLPLYAVAMQEAEASGDERAMRALLERARREGRDDPEIRTARERLEAALARRPGAASPSSHGAPMSTSHVLYGVTIHQAIARGDLERMKQLVAEAEDYLRQAGDVQAAQEQLKLEIEKASRRS